MVTPLYRLPTLFSKPIATITAADVEEVVHAKLPESESLEFKERLSTRKDEPDGWETRRQISDRARRELLKEVVAFANAYGGHLLLGIGESDDVHTVASN